MRLSIKPPLDDFCETFEMYVYFYDDERRANQWPGYNIELSIHPVSECPYYCEQS